MGGGMESHGNEVLLIQGREKQKHWNHCGYLKPKTKERKTSISMATSEKSSTLERGRQLIDMCFLKDQVKNYPDSHKKNVNKDQL